MAATTHNDQSDRRRPIRAGHRVAARLGLAIPAERGARAALIVLGVLLLLGGVVRLLFMLAWRPAFIGYPDAGTYIGAAAGELFSDPMRVAGYPLFLRIVHEVTATLSVTILMQHLLGMATAVVLWLALRRTGAPAWSGLIPAAVVLLGGAQIFLEHAPLSDTLFTFLVAVTLYACTHLLDELNPWWTVAVGLLAGATTTVRVVGLVILPVLLLWVLVATAAPWRKRLLHTGVAFAAAALVIGAYVFAQEQATGYTGLTRAGSWNLYGRVAPIADCSKFTPPPGTRVLCETAPTSERPSPEAYIFDQAASPAVRAFGNPFVASAEGNEKVADFAWAVIMHQPLDYLAEVGRGMLGYYEQRGDLRHGNAYEHFFHRVLFDPTFSEQVRQNFLPYYGQAAQGVSVREGLLERLKDYESVTRIQGPLMPVLMLLSVIGPFVARGRLRSAALLFALVTWICLIAPVATHWWDARLTVPTLGPLAASAALGGWALALFARRVRERRAVAGPGA